MPLQLFYVLVIKSLSRREKEKTISEEEERILRVLRKWFVRLNKK